MAALPPTTGIQWKEKGKGTQPTTTAPLPFLMLYADDTAIVARSREELQAILSVAETILCLDGDSSYMWTKLSLCTASNHQPSDMPKPPIVMGQTQLTAMSEAKYLGVIIAADGSSKAAINARGSRLPG